MFSIAVAIYSTSQMRFLTSSYIALRNDQTDALLQLIRSHVDIQFTRGAASFLMMTSEPEVRQQELAKLANYRARFIRFMDLAEQDDPTEAPAIAAVKSRVLQLTDGVCTNPGALRATAGSGANAPTLSSLFADQCLAQFITLSDRIQPIIDRIRGVEISTGASLERTTSHAIATTFDLILGGLALVMLGGFFPCAPGS